MYDMWKVSAIIALVCQYLFDYFNNYKVKSKKTSRYVLLIGDFIIRIIQVMLLFPSKYIKLFNV